MEIETVVPDKKRKREIIVPDEGSEDLSSSADATEKYDLFIIYLNVLYKLSIALQNQNPKLKVPLHLLVVVCCFTVEYNSLIV